jgi:hypothetical protein
VQDPIPTHPTDVARPNKWPAPRPPSRQQRTPADRPTATLSLTATETPAHAAPTVPATAAPSREINGTGGRHSPADGQHQHAARSAAAHDEAHLLPDDRRTVGDHHRGAGRSEHGRPQPHPNQNQADTRSWNPGPGGAIRPTRDRRPPPRAEPSPHPISPPRHQARRHERQDTSPDHPARAVGTNLAKPARRHHPLGCRRTRRRRQLPPCPRRHRPTRGSGHGALACPHHRRNAPRRPRRHLGPPPTAANTSKPDPGPHSGPA